MSEFPPLLLKDARILLSNDDGIAAPGLKVLEKVARLLSRDVWVVAPELEQSGAGHSLTLRRPLRIRQLGRRRYAVDGTPTDAVLLAINQIMRERKPTLVLSGVNRGGNLGEDVTYSGTIAAAMEATLLGVPAIALSLETVQGKPVRWDNGRGPCAEGDPPAGSGRLAGQCAHQREFSKSAARQGRTDPDRAPGSAQDRRPARRAARPARRALLLDRADALRGADPAGHRPGRDQ